MVFSSVLFHLDPPNNWHKHPSHPPVSQGSSGGGRNNNVHQQNQHLITPPRVPQPPESQVAIGGGGGTQPIHRNSMAAGRARLAMFRPLKAPLKCPRCESTNTKFCYYNNYNQSQPRHFCKSCKRHWTHGGTLRNVPMGGGCRGNKRSSSKSSSNGGCRGDVGVGVGGGGSSSSKLLLSSPTAMVGGDRIPPLMDFPSSDGGTRMSSFMASLQNIAQLGMENLGLSSCGALIAPPRNPPGGFASGGGGSGGSDHHEMNFFQLNHQNPTNNQQMTYPNLGGFEIPCISTGAGFYNLSLPHNNQQMDHEQANNPSKSCSSTIMSSQFVPAVKMESDEQGLNMSKQFMDIKSSSDYNATGNQFWANTIHHWPFHMDHHF